MSIFSPIHPTAETFTHTSYSLDFHPYTLQPRLSPIHPIAQTFSHTHYSPDFGVFKFFFFFYNEMKQKLKLTTSSQSACVQVDSRWLTGITNKDSIDEVSASRAKVRRARDGLRVTDRLSERSGTPEDTWRQMPNKSNTRCLDQTMYHFASVTPSPPSHSAWQRHEGDV